MKLARFCGRSLEWDLAEAAGPQRELALHLAANLDDGGRMAGLLLAHAACPAAAGLWAAHKDANGCTPADVAFRFAGRLPHTFSCRMDLTCMTMHACCFPPSVCRVGSLVFSRSDQELW